LTDKLQDESDDEDSKRMRMLPHRQSTVQANEAPIPDDVKTLLDSVNIEQTSIKSSRVQTSVPVAVLQVLAEQVWKSRWHDESQC
jgi:hypothetical protein